MRRERTDDANDNKVAAPDAGAADVAWFLLFSWVCDSNSGEEKQKEKHGDDDDGESDEEKEEKERKSREKNRSQSLNLDPLFWEKNFPLLIPMFVITKRFLEREILFKK